MVSYLKIFKRLFFVFNYLRIAKMKGQNDYILISNNEGGTALHVAADANSFKVSYKIYYVFLYSTLVASYDRGYTSYKN